MTVQDDLVAMGFDRNRAEKALAKTNYKGLEVAMEWLLAHAEDPDIDQPFSAPQGHSLGSGSAYAQDGDASAAPQQQALSLVCTDCGKKMRSADDCQNHAARSGHQNFSESTEEIKPLTNEQKEDALAKLKDKLQAKRVARAEEDKAQALENEKIRRKGGKELVEMQKTREMAEMKQLADAKRREKVEDEAARERVRAQIAKDKATREAARDAAAGKLANTAVAAVMSEPLFSSMTAAPAVTKTYTEAKVQIRMLSGALLSSKFAVTDTLQTVYDFVQANRSDGKTAFRFKTTHPPQTFDPATYSTTTLQSAGLVPSAVLIMTH